MGIKYSSWMVYQSGNHSGRPPMRYALMKMIITPAMKANFSRIVTTLVSFHCNWSLSTFFFIRLRYLSSSWSAVGSRLRHSSTTLSFARLPCDLMASFCFIIWRFPVESFLCHSSRFSLIARLLTRSKNDIFSGGVASQSLSL